ncbi:hypothetical protein GOODEAATRI_002964 [Goodea atripinnis]|uniref:Uncharacterized protein n=1 Tax=Goodea atripinnis TaxID=208336 RepID=A0ABV0P110_9TELE
MEVPTNRPDSSVYFHTSYGLHLMSCPQSAAKNPYSPKACMKHNPRASGVIFVGAEEAVFSQRHVADERQDEHNDAQNNQTQGLGDADHLGSLVIPSTKLQSRPYVAMVGTEGGQPESIDGYNRVDDGRSMVNGCMVEMPRSALSPPLLVPQAAGEKIMRLSRDACQHPVSCMRSPVLPAPAASLPPAPPPPPPAHTGADSAAQRGACPLID